MKILVSGYYGFGNVGDDAVLEAIVRSLSDLEVTVLSAAPKQTADYYKIKAVQRDDWSRVIKAIAQTDVLVSGGGTLFQDATSFGSFWYYAVLILLAQLMRKKVVVLGQGFGPLNNKLNRWFLRWLLDRTALITLRDEDSLNSLKELGIKRPLELTGDPTGLLVVDDKSAGRKILELEGVPLDQPLLGVSVRKIPRDASQLLQQLAAQLDNLAVRHGFVPVFLLFQPTEDLETSLRVIGLMKEKAHVVFRVCRPEEMLAIISNLEMLVGMRLHSLIFAAVNAVPMVGLSYDPKVASFMKAIGQSCLGLDEAGKLPAVLAGVVNNRTEVIQFLATRKMELKEKAALNFSLLRYNLK